MPNPILPRRSFTPNAVPIVSTDISAPGELVINWADGKAFTKDPAGNLITLTLGGSGGSGGSLSGSVTIPGLGDPYNVALLCHFDGTGSTFTDSSGTPKTIVAVGNATQSSTQSQFGGKSLYLDGTDSRLTASSADFAFGTGDFAIEFWVRPNATSISASVQLGPFQISGATGGLSQSRTDGVSAFFGYGGIGSGANGAMAAYIAGTVLGSGSQAVVTADQWNHVVICRAAGVGRLYVNGLLAGSATAAGDCTGQNLCVGGYYSTNYLMIGHIDELRITKGTARGYTGSAITVPASAFQNSYDLTLPVTITGSGGGGSGEDTALRAYFLPPAPTSVTATAGSAQAVVSWTAPTVLSQTPITDYVVQYSTNSGSTWTTFSDGTSTATTATVTGLTNGTAYTFRVAGVNGVGAGAYSAASSAVFPSMFTPVSVTGLQLWLDASDATGLYDASTGGSLVAADGAVARWEDKSGNARHATQDTAGKRPLRKTGVQGGKDVLLFDGSDDNFVVSGSSSSLKFLHSDASTIFLVLSRPTNASYSTLLSSSNSSSLSVGFWLGSVNGSSTSDKIEYQVYRNVDNSFPARSATGNGFLPSGYSVLSIVADLSASPSGRAAIRRNGVGTVFGNTETAAASTANSMNDLAIGCLGSIVAPFINGSLCEICIYNAALSDTDRAAVESYLMTKWAIT